jgi:hypothetical protein
MKAHTFKKTAKKITPVKKWPPSVTEHSDERDLEKDIFKQNDPKKIAASIKRSAEKSSRKKLTLFNLLYQ